MYTLPMVAHMVHLCILYLCLITWSIYVYLSMLDHMVNLCMYTLSIVYHMVHPWFQLKDSTESSVALRQLRIDASGTYKCEVRAHEKKQLPLVVGPGGRV